MRRAVAFTVLALALAGCGSSRTDVVLRPEGAHASAAELGDAARIVERRLHALHIDATVTVRDDELVVRVPHDVHVPAGASRPGRLAFYDLEAAAGARPRPSRAGNVACGPPQPICPGDVPVGGGTYRYRFRGEPALDERAIAEARTDVDVQTGQPVVVVVPKPAARKPFHDLTRRLAVRGAVRNAPQHLAIVLDGRLLAWPQIDYQQFPNGVDVSSGMQITSLTAHEARVLAAEIEAGALPLRFRVASR